MTKKKPSKPTSPVYTLELTEEQLWQISHACETCARINMLQFDMIAQHVDKGILSEDYCKVRDMLCATATEIKKILPDRNKSEASNTLWDIHQVIRFKLSWDRLHREGKTKPDFYSVDYNDPFKTSKEPLAKIEEKF